MIDGPEDLDIDAFILDGPEARRLEPIGKMNVFQRAADLAAIYKIRIHAHHAGRLFAAAMAASATVELMGGTPEQCMDAGSTVLMNLLGLVCDPVGGLVEYPCQNRNAAGVANALIAAELSLSGVKQLIPFDEMLETMYAVGRRIPIELRETALGGCAATPSACARCGGCG